MYILTKEPGELKRPEFYNDAEGESGEIGFEYGIDTVYASAVKVEDDEFNEVAKIWRSQKNTENIPLLGFIIFREEVKKAMKNRGESVPFTEYLKSKEG